MMSIWWFSLTDWQSPRRVELHVSSFGLKSEPPRPCFEERDVLMISQSTEHCWNESSMRCRRDWGYPKLKISTSDSRIKLFILTIFMNHKLYEIILMFIFFVLALDNLTTRYQCVLVHAERIIQNLIHSHILYLYDKYIKEVFLKKRWNNNVIFVTVRLFLSFSLVY